MGEVFDALKVMNRTLNLGLSGRQMMAAEAKFKVDLGRQPDRHPDNDVPADPVALTEEYELFVSLKRRQKKVSLSELVRMAEEDVAQPTKAVGVRPTPTEEQLYRGIDEAFRAIDKP
jgi:hypothetical protein